MPVSMAKVEQNTRGHSSRGPTRHGEVCARQLAAALTYGHRKGSGFLEPLVLVDLHKVNRRNQKSSMVAQKLSARAG
jgi:hypothetical protein